jgi:hypothetical protein
MAHAGGRPLKFKSVEELQNKIDAYFEYCDEIGEYYTMSGLADYLDIDRVTLIRYGERDEFCNTIKKAKRKVEKQFELNTLKGQYNPTIAIFLMKNNFNYEDRVQQDVAVTERTKAEKLSDELFGD